MVVEIDVVDALVVSDETDVAEDAEVSETDDAEVSEADDAEVSEADDVGVKEAEDDAGDDAGGDDAWSEGVAGSEGVGETCDGPLEGGVPPGPCGGGDGGGPT